MPVLADLHPAPTVFAQLRTELADLAYALERQGRLDAADVVMQLDARVCELAGDCGLVVAGVADPGAGSLPCHCEESREARDEAIHLAGSPSSFAKPTDDRRPALPGSR